METRTTESVSASATEGRLYFVQWLRVYLIALVVAHHAAQPYGPTGGEWAVSDPASSDLLLPFFAINAAFFMGFFFLISGYFVAGSYDRRGGRAFVSARLIKLGIPLAFFGLIVFPLLAYWDSDAPAGFVDYWLSAHAGRWNIDFGHLWFLAQLVTYSLIYAAWRGLSGKRVVPDKAGPWPPPNDLTVFIYTVALAVIGAAIRTVYPQDEWVRVLWLVPVEPAHFPQYASMFAIGIMAGRGSWFTRISTALAVRWFVIGVVAFALAAVLLLSPGRLPDYLSETVVWGFFEAFVAVGMILGLVALFRRYADGARYIVSRIDQYVFGVYIIHVFIVIAIQFLVLPYDLPALVKFAIVTSAAIPASFALSAVIARIPVVRNLFGLA